MAADISLDEDVSRLMQTISNELPPLRGVVQSAGVLDDGILAQLRLGRANSPACSSQGYMEAGFSMNTPNRSN